MDHNNSMNVDDSKNVKRCGFCFLPAIVHAWPTLAIVQKQGKEMLKFWAKK